LVGNDASSGLRTRGSEPEIACGGFDSLCMATHILERNDVRVVVSEFGAHVQSWSDENGDVLFLSNRAVFDGSRAIRGGVPICFPWFGPYPHVGSVQFPAHGFARLSTWRTLEVSETKLTLELTEKDVDKALLADFSDSRFCLRYVVDIGDDDHGLKLSLVVTNTGEKEPLPPITLALHSYFRVAPESVEVRLNAKDVKYIDQLRADAGLLTSPDGVFARFGEEEVDLIALDVPTTVDIADKASGRRMLAIRTQGLPDAVLWNPYKKKAASMSDFGDDEWKCMVCVESANIQRPIVLGPGEVYACAVTLHR